MQRHTNYVQMHKNIHTHSHIHKCMRMCMYVTCRHTIYVPHVLLILRENFKWILFNISPKTSDILLYWYWRNYTGKMVPLRHYEKTSKARWSTFTVYSVIMATGGQRRARWNGNNVRSYIGVARSQDSKIHCGAWSHSYSWPFIHLLINGLKRRTKAYTRQVLGKIDHCYTLILQMFPTKIFGWL